ncbi:MAG TPA: DNA polymerase III subunit alpha [Solirubrobacteraceae bacterium]|nr:DNA polymerase III subunit alpha [Solirubrobacteraceae bacterium]
MTPTATGYVELHCHSAYSFLDGASMPDELVGSAVELGHQALALTDHNGVWGSMEFAHAARGLGLRPIHGAELTLDDDRHVTLLVASARGWTNLCRLLTIAHAHTRDSATPSTQTPPTQTPTTRSPASRLPPTSPPQAGLDAVRDHADGLVCLTGCAERGVHDEAGIRLLRDAFGQDNLRVELQRPFLVDDRARNRSLESLAGRLGLRCVATGNIHAHARSRAHLQDAFVALRHNLTLESSEPLRRANAAHVLSSPEAMAARFREHPQGVAETAVVADQLDFDLTSDLGYRYPGVEDETAQRRLAELCTDRLGSRYAGPGLGVAAGRLEEELRVIDGLGLAGFFLLHQDMLELAREVAAEVRGPDTARALLPPGRGRGSSVSSIVCYLTGLSHIDPISSGLSMGRFLNPELSSVPDIDLDFPRDIREVLIRRVHDRYGRDRAALVATFPSFRSRAAIRELGKVLGLPPAEIERVARGADGFARRIERDIDTALGPNRGRGGRWAWLESLSREAYGLPRHVSQHPGGMVIATRPLIDCVPIVPAAMEGRQLVQWDKDSCADAGFLKIDLLGLGMLSAVERCVETIARTRGERVDLSRIPFDDPATYAAIQDADTTGVFQIESRAQMQSLRRTRPSNLEELAIQVAIIRPGPIQGGAVNPYIERRGRQRENPDYEPPCFHPSLEPVLRETLGTIIFQDQVIEVAQAFCGFSPGEADGLRRAMSRKRSEAAIARYKERFIAGAVRHVGAGRALAEAVWTMVAGFAGFGFPKAHSAAFGLLAYQSTWLRVHYGPEFLCALLNEQPMGFYPPDSLVHEAQRRGIDLLAVDINASDAECTVQADGGVRIGLGYVSGVRAEEIAALVRAREQTGAFRNLADLAGQASACQSSLEQLAWSGACDALAGDRRRALWELGIAAPGRRVPGGVQLALGLETGAVPALRELGRWEVLLADYATTGVSVGDHAMAILRPHLPGVATSLELGELPHGANVTVAGIVVARQRPETASGVVFMLIEDELGTVNLIVPPPVYERHRHIVRAEPLVLVQGRLERPVRGGGTINILTRTLRSLEPEHLERSGEKIARLPGNRPADTGSGSGSGSGEPYAEPERIAAAGGLRAVAPPVQSFGSGRRR